MSFVRVEPGATALTRILAIAVSVA
jgi:hypothetical protein